MSQVTVSPGAGLFNARVNTPDLTLIAQSTSGATSPAKQQLQTLPNGEGEVAVRDEFGNTLATTLKARQVLRDGQWRSEGFVAERMSAYSASAPRSNAQHEPNGYGYLRAEHGKMRVITGRDGRVITKLPQALARTSELIRHGGLSMTTDAQAQTAKDVYLRKPRTPMVTSTQLTQWKPVIPLPKPIEKMSPVDRAKYMVKEALRVAPASVRKELQGLLRPQNLALMAGFAAAQAVPGVNVAADLVAGLMLGKEVTETGLKIIGAIRSGLNTQQPYELVKAGDQLAEAFSHLGVGAGIALIGGVAARGAGKLGTKAAPVEGLPLPRPSKLPGANNAVPLTRRPRSKPSGHHPDGSAPSRRRPAGSAVATAAAPARARTALATAQSNGIRQQGNHASHTPVPAVPPLPTVRAAAVLPLPLPTVQTLPEDKPQSEKRRGTGAGSSGVPPGVTRTSAEEAKLKAWLTRQGDPLREQQLNAYREGRITDKEDVLGGRTGADRKDMSAALDKIDRTRIGPSRGGGAGRSHTTAEVKNIWRQIDKRGGVDALPEATLREVTGITEQALKDTRLTPAEHSDFTHRLADSRQAQTRYHKARAATKTKPPVDMSGSNLPIGESVFGKPPDPGKSFPGLIQPAGQRRPASLTAPSTQSFAGQSAGPGPSRQRNLPPAVSNLMRKATNAGSEIPLQVVTKVMDGLGNVPARDAVNLLVKNDGLPLSQARELVGAVRLGQRQASAFVKSSIDKLGPKFSMQDWARIEPWTDYMPKTDNPVARQLINMKSDSRFIINGTSMIEPRALQQIDKYLRSTGYDPNFTSQSASPTFGMNPTAIDKVFTQMLERRGATGSPQSKVVIGVIDLFGDPKQPNHPANFGNQEPLSGSVPAPPTLPPAVRGHGAGVTSVATAGSGNRLEVKTFGVVASDGVVQGVQSLVSNGSRVINVSLGWEDVDDAKPLRDAVLNHPDVHFVVAAENNGRHSRQLNAGISNLADLPNVTYVGSVDRDGQVSSFSNYQGSTSLYAWGQGRSVADVGEGYDIGDGTSLSAPFVAGLMGKVMTVDPGLDPAGAKRIVAITADKVRQRTATDLALKDKTVLVVNSDDAVRLAAVTNMVRRGISMDSAMQKLGFDATTRAKMEPRARQILKAERRAVDK